MAIWLVYAAVNPPGALSAAPQDASYGTVVVMFTAVKVEQVNPVVRPTLATFPFAARTAAGSPMADEGGAAAMLVDPAGPRSRMAPVRSTVVGTIVAIAASTLLGANPQGEGAPLQGGVVIVEVGFSAACSVRLATC